MSRLARRFVFHPTTGGYSSHKFTPTLRNNTDLKQKVVNIHRRRSAAAHIYTLMRSFPTKQTRDGSRRLESLMLTSARRDGKKVKKIFGFRCRPAVDGFAPAAGAAEDGDQSRRSESVHHSFTHSLIHAWIRAAIICSTKSRLMLLPRRAARG